jgi:hypothetical protein
VFSGGPLPVTFVSVTANREVRGIAVSWVVQNEPGIAGYKVEKSTDGINFIIVNTFPATSANSNAGYTWLDRDVDAGVAFYRVCSVDIAGRIGFSKIVKVNSSLAPASLRIYPNPICGGKFNLRFSNMPAGKYQLNLFNTLGQLLFSTSVTVYGNYV